MSDFYTSIRDDTVNVLVEKFGVAITVERQDSSLWEKKYDPTDMVTFWENVNTQAISLTPPTGVPTTYTANAVKTRFEKSEFAGTLIEQGDILLLVSELSVEPQSGDVFIVSSVRYTYVNHENVQPAGVNLMYKVQVRE